MKRRRKSKNPMFDEAFWESDPLQLNAAIAKGGATYEALRAQSDRAIIAMVNALVLDPSHVADVDFWMREILRREQARTNRILLWLAVVATCAGIIQAAGTIWAITH